MMNNVKLFRVLLLGGLRGGLMMGLMTGLMTGGCMMPRSNPHLGSAVTAAMARQIADPVASTREDSSVGLDGGAGANVMESYRHGFAGQQSSASLPQASSGAK